MKKPTFSIDKRKTSKTQLIELCSTFRNRSAIALKLAGTGPNRNQVQIIQHDTYFAAYYTLKDLIIAHDIATEHELDTAFYGKEKADKIHSLPTF